MGNQRPTYDIREAISGDFNFVVELMDEALTPYYGGDHRAHAERIFETHVSGGHDRIGHFSHEQKMFIAMAGAKPAGIVHIVGKRQGTYKISPIIVAEEFRGNRGLGSALLNYAESYAIERGARQIYCTVARENLSAWQFFVRKGYLVAGRSESHYKSGITEVMLYKPFVNPEFEKIFDRENISVHPCDDLHEPQVRQLLLSSLPTYFVGIDESWVDALFNGYRRRNTRDINQKYKLIYVAVDREDRVLGVAGATPKKGEPIKVMPFIATTQPAFIALLTDVPYALKSYGHKLYIHITPTVDETVALQQRGWRLDAAMPAAYRDDQITQQWSLDILGEDVMRSMRVKQNFLDLIKKGIKTLEVRVGYPNIKTIEPGERIMLRSRTQHETIFVKDVRQYETFEEMLDFEDAGRITPGLSGNELLKLLKEIYPPDLERYGVYVLDIRVDR